jgi:hypothetical protein
LEFGASGYITCRLLHFNLEDSPVALKQIGIGGEYYFIKESGDGGKRDLLSVAEKIYNDAATVNIYRGGVKP